MVYDMATSVDILIAACTGASLQEVVYWYGQREIMRKRPHSSSTDNDRNSWFFYWIITFAMIIGSAIGTYYWFSDRIDMVSLRDVLITGAAFPSLLKIAVESYSKTNKSTTKLGKKSKLTNAAYGYFMRG